MATKDKEQSLTNYDQSGELQTLRDEIKQLRMMVKGVAEANAIENVIMNGFTVLATQLQPLRELAPARTLLKEGGAATLRSVRAALERPNWRSSNFEIETSDDQSQQYQTRSLAP